MVLTLLIVVGVCIAFAGLLSLWFIPDSTLEKGPKVMMFLFVISLIGFLVWLVAAVPRPTP